MIERYTPTLERRETLDERMARPMGGVALAEAQIESNDEINLGAEFQQLDPELQEAILGVRKFGEPLKDNGGEIKPEIGFENIVFVRKNDYLPDFEDGKVVEKTWFERTKDEEIPSLRMTTHWTLNEGVGSHMMGNWENSPVTIVAPGKQTIEKNGLPQNLYSVDTFWTHGIELPKGSVIIEKSGNFDQRVEVRGGVDIIHISEDENANQILSLVIKKMGYSQIEGGTHASNEHGFDDKIRELATKADIPFSTKHENVTSMEKSIEGFTNGLVELDGKSKERIFNQYWDKVPEVAKREIIGHMLSKFQGKRPDESDLKEFVLNSEYNLEARRDIYQHLPTEFWGDYMSRLFETTQDKSPMIEGFMDESDKRGIIKELAEVLASDEKAIKTTEAQLVDELAKKGLIKA
jgi:hypothetical protein